jgi:hypothetical protein
MLHICLMNRAGSAYFSPPRYVLLRPSRTSATRINKKTITERQIDENRIYLSGISSGGSACWWMGKRYSEVFAALAPLASSFTTHSSVDELSSIPVSAFHSKYEINPSPEPIRRSVAQITQAGGDAFLTEIESNAHDCWSADFGEHRLLDWLLLQKRGEPVVPPFQASLTVQLREFAFRYGILFVLFVSIFLARSRFVRPNAIQPLDNSLQ